jgi:hypothetical protein
MALEIFKTGASAAVRAFRPVAADGANAAVHIWQRVRRCSAILAAGFWVTMAERMLRQASLGALALVAMAACNGEESQHFDARPRPVDAAPPPPGDARLGVDCLGQLCAPEQACCSMVAEPPLVVEICVPEPENCDGEAYECDGPEDCASQTCCSPTEGHVRCVDAGTCDRWIACHEDTHCPPALRCCDTPKGIIRVCLAACR